MPHFLKICAASALLAASSFAAQAADAQVVVRDADTGQLRAATPSEAQALRSQAPETRSAVMSPLARKAHPSGAQGARLTEEFMSYSVMVRQPDGRLVEYCFENRAAYEAAMSTGGLIAKQLPTE